MRMDCDPGLAESSNLLTTTARLTHTELRSRGVWGFWGAAGGGGAGRADVADCGGLTGMGRIVVHVRVRVRGSQHFSNNAENNHC